MTCLQLDCLEVDFLAHLALHNLEEKLTVGVPSILPQPIQKVIPHLQIANLNVAKRYYCQ